MLCSSFNKLIKRIHINKQFLNLNKTISNTSFLFSSSSNSSNSNSNNSNSFLNIPLTDNLNPNNNLNKTIRKKTKTIRQVEIEAERQAKSLGDYDWEDKIIKYKDRKKVHAVCSAESYDVKKLYSNLVIEYPTCQLFANEIVRFSLNGKECFIFDMGAIVTWDMSRVELDDLREAFRIYESTPIFDREYDEIDFTVNNENELSYLDDKHEPIMVIGGKQSERNIYLDKLAVSHGIAYSVKLSILENQLDVFIESIKHFPIALQSGQQIRLTRTQALSKLGELLQFRAVLNLHSGIIETPDIYWNYTILEQHYRLITNEFDIKQRIESLNCKLDYANDIAELLKNYLSERHSLKLEWAIIILIAIEVGFELLHFGERFV